MMFTCRTLKIIAILVFIYMLPILLISPPVLSQGDERLKRIEFYTRPENVQIYVKDEKISVYTYIKNIRKPILINNITLNKDNRGLYFDLSKAKDDDKVKFEFTCKNYYEEYLSKVSELRKYSRIPLTGEIVLKPTQIKFNTDPKDAEVFVLKVSTKSGWSFLGNSKNEINIKEKMNKIDLYKKMDVDIKYSYLFKKRFYKDRIEEIALSEFKRDSENIPTFPADNSVIKLEPTIPVLSPFLVNYYDNRERIVIYLGVTVFLFIMFGFVTPVICRHMMSLYEAKKRLIAYEKIMTKLDNTDPMNKKEIDDYVIIGKIGAGGMATVYMAVPKKTYNVNDAVAIKVMQMDIVDNPEFCQRFKREMRITSSLIHPNILRILDYGDQEGLLYIVMELIRGQRLRDVIPDDGLSFPEFINYFRPILSALEYAHGKGVVHRDLKPQNIMVTEEGKIIVMDFGLARTEGSSTITASGAALGTPAYMAPELVSGKKFDTRTDQYSLGVMAFQMLTGRLPFYDENTVKLMLKHISDQPPPLREIRKDLPEALEKVILKMLEKEPEMRYPGLREVHISLENILKEHYSQEQILGGERNI